MSKKIMSMILVTSLILISLFPAAGFAESKNKLDGIQEERNQVQENISEQEQELNQLVSEMQELEREAEALNEQMAEKEAEIDAVNNQIGETVEEIENLQAEIESLEESIDERFELLKTRASSYQKNGGAINYIEVLFGAQSFGDLISRLTAVTQIADSDAQLMKQIEEDIETVEAHQMTTAEKLNELNDMRAETETQLAAIESEKETQQVVMNDLTEKQEEVVTYVQALESEDSSLQAMETEVKAEIAQAAKRKQEAEEKRKREAALAAKEEQERQAAAKKQAEREKEKVAAAPPAEKENKTSNNKKQLSKTENVKEEKTASNKPEGKKSFTVTSTAYTANCAGCSGVTATGIDLNKNPNQKVIAVDPSVIPLGSVVEVEGYGFAVAGDTGGAIKGNKIDVYVKSKSEAFSWGVRTVRVTIQ